MSARRSVVAALAVAGVLLAGAAAAQWLQHPMKGIPRTADGKVNLDAPTPRLDGKPDFSGLWEHDSPFKFLDNIAADLGGEPPMTPGAKKIYDERVANRGADDPNGFCLPSGPVEKHAVPAPFKILQRPDLLVILYESRTTFRQIHLDGRALPEDPQPTWDGYSVGRWDNDTLVVDSLGFNGRLWLDGRGHPTTEKLRVTERFTRPTFGRLQVEITIDDPGAYTKPWSVKQGFHFLPDTELIEHICEENNKLPEQLPDAAPR